MNIKTFRLYMILPLLFLSLLATSSIGQNSKLITGTVGKEHMVGEKLVVCELGSQACLFLSLDPGLTITVDGKEYKAKDLQVGWYVQAKVETVEKLGQTITDLVVDPTKTIICFTSLTEEDSEVVEKQLLAVKGIYKVKPYLESKQIYIEYNPDSISYPEIEKLIIRSGYKIE
ncbi:MAG TPA: heavy-metal-associated domain-containing protein [Caldithrix abyssi]|uniref:Heavy-metal-associated domain-containing protein n=1 Tax=Caldithrix abyssi TaxID=187145 RepID=A0A7V4U2B5_CALAY|nr:heavy-metal-associated domain-containing protein [Caldithrix abyssi]